MSKYRSIDLFAGIGGIRLGFDNAFGKDIETVFVSEWDEFAQKTYKLNFEDSFDIAGDITAIKEKDIPSLQEKLILSLGELLAKHFLLPDVMVVLMMTSREETVVIFFLMLSESVSTTNPK